ncbi:uncharacterized protein LOC21391009 isoform X2 [Morus notabilis]|uniref:uncharacterized protein LOC21391009 isoform X2 n=1 Tax=Morus notabilis TaxID=981085 RepID=UPI000CED18C0|nr:uncharacterized protein LOC21391009 isoform X2 [Morus notabilis]
MAFDQNSIPKDLRPLNIVRNVVEEPRIVQAAAGRSPEGYFPNPVSEVGSPRSVPVFYPAPVPVSEAGIVGLGYGNTAPNVAAWCPHVAVPVAYPSVNPAVGFGYGPNLANRVTVAGSGDLVSSNASTASRGSPNLGNLVSVTGVDLSSHDMAARIGYTPSVGSRVAGNSTDQIVSDPAAGSSYGPNLGGRSGGNAVDQASDEGGVDSVSGKKVKFLCSFGGKILPRPSDSLLRYVGGHTRFISVKRDLSFNELVQKMVDIYGQAVVIKYQLPDEDLDALVSVSCPDDLDNMMDEYEKLNERCPDGSAKLRVFLFSASELDPTSMVQFGESHDNGQRYVEAVNGIVGGGGGGGITRKGSITSATSTQNSDFSGSEAVDNSMASQADVIGPVTTNILLQKQSSGNLDDVSPRLVCLDPSPASFVEASTVPPRVPMVKSGLPQTSSPCPEVDLERSIPAAIAHQQLGLQQPGMEIPTPSYVQAYVDPRQEVANEADYLQLPPQTGFPNPRLLGTAGPVYTQQQLYGNAAGVVTRQFIPTMCTTMNPSSSHVGIRQNVVQHIIQPQQARLGTYVDERAFGPRVVQLPVEQSYSSYQVQVPASVVGGNNGWQQVPMQEHVVFSDGLLPHQQGQRDSGASSLSDSNPSYHSLHFDDHSRAQPATRVVVSGALGESTIDQGVAARHRVLVHADPQIGSLQSEASAFSLHPEAKLEKERINTQHVDNVEHNRISATQAVIGRTTDVQPPKSAFMGNIPQSVREDPVQQHSVVAPYLVKQDALNKPVTRDMLPAGGIPVQSSERLTQDSPKSPTDYSNKFPSVAPTKDAVETCISYDQVRPIEGRMEALRICPTELSVSNEQSRSPVDQFEASYGIPTELLPCSSMEPPHIPTSRLVESYEVAQPSIWGNPGPCLQAKVGGLPLDSNEVYHGNPPFPGMDTPSSFSPSSRTADVQDSSNSLFSNQDPWNLHHDSHFPPPRPIKSPSKKDPFATKDPFGENCLGNGAELNTVEDGVQQSLGILNKDQSSEHAQSAKGLGSAEEQIRNDLQAVAEGVAASVFQSATSSNPDLHDRNELANESIQDEVVENKVEDVKTKIPERANIGFPVSDGIGRLQIIKNSDLEELRELGSGTFGTVYHGKWRGTDVAIKRINDRCFAGKPSEQERMRDDFWNEAIKLADLHHPNVLAFYGVVLDGPGGSVATVTEYMVNGSIRNALQKNEKSLDKRRRLLIAMDVAFGMEYLHGKNIVHFDLKSDNLLVNLRDPHRPICKVGDLGLSKVKCQTLISGGVRGTLPWMAPELLNGSSSLVSEKVDVFSFGIVLWELLTGEEPYADLHYGAIIGGILSNTLRPPVPEFCNPEWKSLMERCWASEPSERPSFTEIANQLRAMAAKIPKGHSQHQQPSTTQPPV